METYIDTSIGGLTLINYLIDQGKVGQKDLLAVAELLRSIPQELPSVLPDQTARVFCSKDALDWIKRQMMAHLENNNIPARLALAFFQLASTDLLPGEIKESVEEE